MLAPMCIYSITTNQAAILALLRVLHRYAANARRLPRLSRARDTQRGSRKRNDDDAFGVFISYHRAVVPRSLDGA